MGDNFVQFRHDQKIESNEGYRHIAEKKKIILVGGCGFVGGYLLNAFNNSDAYQVSIIDQYDNPNITSCSKYIGNIGNIDFVNQCITDVKPDIIYYLVSNFLVASVNDFADAVRMSIININNLFDCLNSNIRFIWTGSSAQYGSVPISCQPVCDKSGFYPVSNYGALKVFEETEIRRLSKKKCIDLIATRIFNITGPGEPTRMVGGAFVSQLIKDNNLKVGNLFPKRDFLDIRDVASALKIIGENGEPECTYNICSGRSVSINEYLKYISYELDIEPIIEIDQSRINKNDIIDLVGDNSKLKALGWNRKFDLKQTITDLVKSYREKIE